MPTVTLTDAAVKRLSAPSGERVEYFDASVAGLCLRVAGDRTVQNEDGEEVQKKGSRVWYRYYRRGGKLIRLKLGTYPAMSLARARLEANNVEVALETGSDPRAVRVEAKRQAEVANKDTVPAVIEAYLADLAKRPKKKGGKRSPRYIEETRRNLANHVLPRWGSLNIHDITRRDVGDLLEAVRDDGTKAKGKDGKPRKLGGGGIVANRTLAAIRSMFNYAMRRGIIDATPAAMVEPPGEETARERILSADEIAAIWKAAGQRYPFGHFFRLALILGQRRQEIATMRWEHLDLDEATWTLPAEATKGKRMHVVPLPQMAVDILRELPRKSVSTDRGIKPSPYVFTTSGETPISGFSKAKSILDDAVTEARGGSALAAWTIHDMRRTVATGMAKLGVSEFIIARVLNHVRQGVTSKHYVHTDYIAEKRLALDAWAKHLGTLVPPPPAGVEDLAEHRAKRAA